LLERANLKSGRSQNEKRQIEPPGKSKSRRPQNAEALKATPHRNNRRWSYPRQARDAPVLSSLKSARLPWQRCSRASYSWGKKRQYFLGSLLSLWSKSVASPGRPTLLKTQSPSDVSAQPSLAFG